MKNQFKKSFRQMWIIMLSKFIAILGSSIYNFGISFFIMSHTGSALSFSINLICGYLPKILIAPYAGQLVDFYNRKRIVVYSQVLQAIIILGLFIYVKEFGLSLYAVYVASILLSALNGILSPAITASLPDLVHDEHLQKAMGYNSAAISLSSLIGPILGGMIFGFVDINIFLLAFIGAFLISSLLDASLDFLLFKSKQHKEKNNVGALAGFKEAFNYLWSNKVFKAILILAITVNFFFASLNVGVTKVFIVHLQASSQMVGFIESAFSIGVMLGGVIVGRRKKFVKPFNSIYYSQLTMALCLSALSIPLMMKMNLWEYFYFYMSLLIIMGINIQFTNNPFFVLLQQQVDDNLRGRVFSIMEMIATTLMPISYIIFGVLFDLGYYAIAFLICGICIFFITISVMNKNIRTLGNSMGLEKRLS